MLKIKLAEFNIDIDNKYDYIADMCARYLTDSEAEFTVSVNDAEMKREEAEGITGKGYLESLAIYRKIAEFLPYHNSFLMHGVVLDIEKTGVAFLAQSGVGKTTHMVNWKRVLGDRMLVVNGDKPIIRIKDDGVYAYGTPWAGKENIHLNMKTKLKKVCFIQRAEKNECFKADSDILKMLMPQIYRPSDPKAYINTLDILNTFAKNVEFYIIKCTKDVSSAEVATKVILGE